MNNKYFDYYDHISNKFLSALKKSDKQAILLTKIDKYINKKGGSYSTFKPITPLLNTKLNNITKLPKEMGTTKINTVTMAPSMSNINNVINEHYKYLLGIFKTINELIMKINILQKNRVDGTIITTQNKTLTNLTIKINALALKAEEEIFGQGSTTLPPISEFSPASNRENISPVSAPLNLITNLEKLEKNKDFDRLSKKDKPSLDSTDGEKYSKIEALLQYYFNDKNLSKSNSYKYINFLTHLLNTEDNLPKLLEDHLNSDSSDYDKTISTLERLIIKIINEGEINT